MSVINDHSESINKLIETIKTQNEGKRLKYLDFSEISKQNIKAIFLLNNSTTQSFPFLFSSMFSFKCLVQFFQPPEFHERLYLFPVSGTEQA